MVRHYLHYLIVFVFGTNLGEFRGVELHVRKHVCHEKVCLLRIYDTHRVINQNWDTWFSANTRAMNFKLELTCSSHQT